MKPTHPTTDSYPTFEYCALRYLLLWEQKEREISQKMREKVPQREALRTALHYFRVARNFPGLAKDDCADRVLKAVTEVGASDCESSEKVDQLVCRFNKDFGGKNLSAATKLLWLRFRRPFVIYDARTVAALSCQHDFNKSKYAEYEAAWRDSYKVHRHEIDHAVQCLPSLHPFFTQWHLTPNSMDRLIKHQWFRERVFDIYLWERGGKAD